MGYVVGKTQEHSDPAIRRIDHLICEVPDIHEALRHFTDVLGFPEAWPVGRFWPSGRTCGVALGGLNLEFIQLDENPIDIARITTIVFEPTSLEAAQRQLAKQGIQSKLFEKIEPDPALLALRGFPPEQTQTPQLICRNLLIEGASPFPFFFCDYVPFLRERLDIASPHGKVIRLSIQMEERPGGIRLFSHLGYLGDVEIYAEEEAAEPTMATEIRLDTGPLDLQGFPAAFRFS